MYIKIYDKNHSFIDDIRAFNNPKTVHTLNGVNKFTFDLALNLPECNEVTLKFMNHVEFIDDNENVVWWGIIVTRDFNSPKVLVGCYGYLQIFKRRCLNKIYKEQEYGKLIEEMLNDMNSIYPTPINFGTTDKTERTQRTTKNKDFFDEKILEYVNSAGYFIEIDKDRKLNVKSVIKNDRDYTLQYRNNGENNNIIKFPQLSQSIIETANNCYGETEVENETGEDPTLLFSEFEDEESIFEYGRIDGVTSINDGVVLQETVSKYVQEDLSKRKLPLNNITVSIADTFLCPFDTLKVGYTVNLIIDDYFNLNIKTKVIEISRDWRNKTADITVGETLYKPAKPTINFY